MFDPNKIAKIPALLAMVLFGFIGLAAAQINTGAAGQTNPTASPAGATAPGASTRDSVTPVFDNSTIQADRKAAAALDDYKTSLKSLSDLYKTEVERLEKQNAQLKELYSQGLISRVEMEAGDKALTDARAKVDDVGRQIAAANQPQPLSDPEAVSSPATNQIWSTGSTKVDGLIRFYGNQYGVDPYLIFCLMSQESKFASIATSSKGAQGLMQLMPGTAARYGVTNPYDVAQSIMGGTRYLKDLLKMFNGRVDLALAGYNAGENAVIKYGYAVPPYDETRNYVRLIIARYGKKRT